MKRNIYVDLKIYDDNIQLVFKKQHIALEKAHAVLVKITSDKWNIRR